MKFLCFTNDLWKINRSYDGNKPSVLFSLIATLLHRHGDAWNPLHTASPHVARFWNNKNGSFITWYESTLKWHIPHWNYTAASTTHPLHLHTDSTFPLFPYPHSRDHQPKHSSPFTTPNSYAYSAGKFRRNRHGDSSSISPLCAYGGPTQTYFHSGTAPTLTQSKGNFGFSVWCHCEKNAAFGCDHV